MTICQDTGPTPVQDFVAELDRLPIDDSARAQVHGLLRRMVGQSLRITRRDIERPARIRAALALLAAGNTTTQTRIKLASSLQCSRDTARRIVTEALRQRAEAGIRSRQGQGSPDAAKSLYGAGIQGVE